MEREIDDAPGRFDQIIARLPESRPRREHSEVHGSLRNVAEIGFLTSTAVDPKILRGELTIADEESATLTRITPNRFALIVEKGQDSAGLDRPADLGLRQAPPFW
jgi:hypothetical protein